MATPRRPLQRPQTKPLVQQADRILTLPLVQPRTIECRTFERPLSCLYIVVSMRVVSTKLIHVTLTHSLLSHLVIHPIEWLELCFCPRSAELEHELGTPSTTRYLCHTTFTVLKLYLYRYSSAVILTIISHSLTANQLIRDPSKHPGSSPDQSPHKHRIG